jgi:hypothetical protein
LYADLQRILRKHALVEAGFIFLHNTEEHEVVEEKKSIQKPENSADWDFSLG